ncbi:MAG: DUF5702 domain-containing protein [Acutalibacteraceae bacterium]
MFNRFKKTKGVISIFLVIILIPMMTASSIFVDVSKYVLAKSVAESAGDLTLNTILTHYDRELNEYFGLIASAQDIDSVLGEMEDFFVSCMVSQGINEEDANTVLERLSAIGGSGEDGISDFLGISLGDGGFEAKKVNNGSLVNPALMKTQIVEFMKYRGPINSITDFISQLKSGSSQFEKTDEITDMVNEKSEFYESENELMQTLFDIYMKLKDYDSLNITADTIESVRSKTGTGSESYISDYKLIHKKLVFDLHNTYGEAVFGGSGIKAYGNIKGRIITKKETVIVPPSEDGAEGTSEQQEVPDIEKALNDAAGAIGKYLSAKNSLWSLLRTCGVLDNNDRDVYNQGVYNTQYWVQTADAFQLNKTTVNNYISSANAMAQAIKNMEVTYDAYTKDTGLKIDTVNVRAVNGVETSGLKSVEAHRNALKKQYDDIAKNSILTYQIICDRLVDFSDKALNQNKPSLSCNDSAKRDKVDEKIKDIYTSAHNYHVQLESGSEIIQKTIDLTLALKGKLEKYNTNFSNWETAANKISADESEVARIDQEEIKAKKNGGSKSNSQNMQDKAEQNLIGKINDADVDQLYSRLCSIKSLLDASKTAIEECKYFDTSVKDIENTDKAVSVMFRWLADNGKKTVGTFIKSELENLSNDIEWKNTAAIPGITKDNNPEMVKGQVKLRDLLYNYFKDYNPETDNAKKEQGENAKKDAEKLGDKEVDELDLSPLLSASTELKDKRICDSQLYTDAVEGKKSRGLSEISDFVGRLFSNFSGTMSQAMVDMRDDLLVSDYIMSMFSYDTFEAEKRLEYAVKEKGYEITNAAEWVGKMGEYSDEWKDESPTFSYNKNLRNKMINDTNCYSYGNEIEYILYGKDNAGNKSSAYGSIYMIRFALDLPLVFAKYWNDATVTTLANSISAATYGIVPAALIQLAVCLGLTAAEAAVDLTYIKAGIGVKFIKTNKDKDLFVSFESVESSMSGSIGSNSKDSNGKVGVDMVKGYFQYSDYLRMFLLLNLLGSGESGICARTADVIQANMGKITGSGFALSKSQVYFKITADIKVDPMMLALPINADEEGNLADVSSWNTFSYEMVRGY